MKAEIQTSELRIGNLFQDKKERLCKVEQVSILLEDCQILATDSAITSMPISPIPLTEEWLERFGFKIISKHSYWNYKHPTGFKISMWMEDKPVAEFEEKGVCYWGDEFVTVKYVHQVQNLFYALTGSELTLNTETIKEG